MNIFIKTLLLINALRSFGKVSFVVFFGDGTTPCYSSVCSLASSFHASPLHPSSNAITQPNHILRFAVGNWKNGMRERVRARQFKETRRYWEREERVCERSRGGGQCALLQQWAREREREERERATEACMPCVAYNGVWVSMVTRGCGQARPIASRQIYNIASNWPARQCRSAVVQVGLSLGGLYYLHQKEKRTSRKGKGSGVA